MASSPKWYDRVQATSTTTGTGTYTLGSAVTGFQAWSAVGDGNSAYYCAEEVDANGNASGGWEVGLGTYTSSGTTLSRDSISASSNSGSAVNWAAGTRRIMLVSPASWFSAMSTLTEVSITTGSTLTASAYGLQHVCSGTSANYTVVLPTAVGHTGETIAFRMSNALTKLVTIDGNSSETIDGRTTRIMWAGETVVLMSDGTNWEKLSGKSIPMSCTMFLATGQQPISSGSMTKVNLDTSASDPTGAMADTTNKRINIPRPGTWMLVGQTVQSNTAFNNGVTSERVITQLRRNGSQISTAECPANNTFPAPVAFSVLADWAASDYAELAGYQQSGGNTGFYAGATLADGGCQLNIVEVPLW